PSDETVQRLYRQAPEEIKKALQALGHYHPQIHSELARREGRWEARFTIDAGPPVRVEKVDLKITGEGETDPPFEAIPEQFPLKPGAVLNHGLYEDAKKKMQGLAAERGYFDARFTTSELQVDVQRNRADILLHFETGRRYRIGKVSFGGTEFDPGFLSRFVPFKPGEPYHTSHLLALQGNLVNSDYFATVDVRVLTEEAKGDQVPIAVTLTAKKKYQLSAGVGYGTDTGARVKLGWEDRQVNLRGHRFRTELELSQIEQHATATYEIPLARPPADKLQFQAGWKHEHTVTAESQQGMAGVARTKGRTGGWIETLSLNYQAELFQVGDQTGSSRLLLPGISWARTLADNQNDPRRGSRLSFGVKGTTRTIGSDIDLIQAETQGKLIRPFGERGRILLRGDLGWSRVSDFSRLPASLRFFAGGDRSIRGYRYQSLGPEDESGKVIGGRSLAVGSVEYDHRIKKDWSLAVFYDAGNAFNDWRKIDLKQGAGIGARWHSPVGPVRLDLAYAISEPGITLRLHFNMGPDL
ncbi:MAG TPA: autotransporter assembly complex family protein, partial [Candidatus Manganitrophaceae bacterium]|nr:autotransporter assembly complex family protein [Candidatus Manganitrophaceae bacterium]